MLNKSLILVAILTFYSDRTSAEDWTRFRGPRLNGISSEELSTESWGDAGPKLLWKQNVQTGVSGIVVSGDQLYTMGNDEDQDTVFCLNVHTGKLVWKHSYDSPTDANEFEGGPTSTPTIDGDVVFSLSRQGDVHCFDRMTGQVKWQTNVPDETGIRIPGWGFAGSPFVADELLLLNIGDAGVALEKSSGHIKWQSADKDAGYSSIVPLDDSGAVVFGSARSYVCVQISDGKELWRQRWLTTFGCNAADPIVSGGHVFLSSGYNRGSGLLKATAESAELVWKNKDMQNQLSTSILMDDHLYGIHGDVDAGTQLRCIAWKTGEVKWSEESFRPGAISAAGKKLIILTNDGELVVGEASPSKFMLQSRQSVLDGKCWTAPVLSGGRLYCRNIAGDLACFAVGGSLQND